MPLAQTQAYIIARENFRENDRLLTMLTAEEGVQKAVAPGAARGKNRFGGSLELFTRINLFYYWHQEKTLWTISRAETARSYYQEISRPENVFHFFVISEILSRAVAHNVSAARLFRLTGALLEAVAEGIPAPFLLLYFTVWFCRIEGFLFNFKKCGSCGGRIQRNAAVKSDYAALLCHQCLQNERWLINDKDIALLETILKTPPREFSDGALLTRSSYLAGLFLEKIEYQLELKLQSKYCLSPS